MKAVEKRSDCPISLCLDFVGDKWSLLIFRDMILDGKATYGEFLESDEHIATNILAARLKMLEQEGFIIKYSLEGRARTGYCLTKKGIDLIPVITEMSLWGAQYSRTNMRKELMAALRKDKDAVIKQLTEELTKKYQAVRKNAIA